jgi:hypothetical protein
MNNKLSNFRFAISLLFYALTVGGLSSFILNKGKQQTAIVMAAKLERVVYQTDSCKELTREMKTVTRYFGPDTVAKMIYKAWAWNSKGLACKTTLGNNDDGSPQLYNIAEPSDSSELRQRIENCPNGFRVELLGDDDVKIAAYLVLGNTSRTIPIRQQADHVTMVYFQPKYEVVIDSAVTHDHLSKIAAAIPHDIQNIIRNLDWNQDCDNVKPYSFYTHPNKPRPFVDFLGLKHQEYSVSIRDYAHEYWKHVLES